MICLNGQDNMLEAFHTAGTAVSNLRTQLSLQAIWDACAIARSLKPDIIHGAVFEGVILAAAAALVSPGARLAIEEIDYPIHRSWRGNLLLRTLALRADVCVGVSPAVMEYLDEVARIPERKRRLIVNGISPPSTLSAEERTALRKELGIPADAFVIGSVGRLRNDHKRFSDLIEATAQVRRRHPSVHLLIVGEGPDLELLRRRSDELGMRGYLTLAGYHADVGRMFSLMDLFALVSERESFGLVFAEAMFSGLAVVATRAGGIPHVVAEGETALLVEVGNPRAVAEALERFIEDDPKRIAFGRAGRERAEVHFGAARYVSDVERVYLELVRGRPGSSALAPQPD